MLQCNLSSQKVVVMVTARVFKTFVLLTLCKTRDSDKRHVQPSIMCDENIFNAGYK